jgi:PAS domain S-box-containing protein
MTGGHGPKVQRPRNHITHESLFAGKHTWLVSGAFRFLPGWIAMFIAEVASRSSLASQKATVTRANAVTKLARVCLNIDGLAGEANSSYLALLARYPKSSKLLRAYARFQLTINQANRDAEKFMAEADRLDENAADEGPSSLEREGQFKATSLVDDSVDSLVVIDSRGTITSVNSNCRRLFGHSESEMIGRNVSMLIPQEYAVQHDSFIHNYLTTGVAKVIGSPRKLYGKYRDGHSIPIELAVQRVDTPQGVTFAAILHGVAEDDAVASVVINTEGIIMSCNRVFSRMFGWNIQDILAKTNIKKYVFQNLLWNVFLSCF